MGAAGLEAAGLDGDQTAAGLAGQQPEDDGRAACPSVKLAAPTSEAGGALACRKGSLAPHPAAAVVARTGGGACPGRADGKGAYGAALCAIAIHELDEEAIELIFTFLPVEDRRSAAAVCRLWRRVHNSSTKLWGSVLLSGERIAAASSSAAAIVSWLGARLEAMRSVRLWSPCLPLEAFASGLAQLLSRENRLQSFSYVSTDASVSRLLGELQGLTSLQLLDILSPAFGSGQGLVVKARELAKLKPLSNLLSLQLHAREIRGSLPPALFRCLNRLQHLAISAKCRLPAAVVAQLSGLQSLELHGASMDVAAAEAAASLQQLTRLAISVHSQRCEEREQEEEAGGGGGARRRRGGAAAKAAACGEVQRWQDHAIWGQLPQLARLQQLWVGAELPEAGGGGGGQRGASILPYDVLEGALTHLVLPVALTALPDLVPGQLAGLAALDLTHSIRLHRLVLNGAPLAGGHLPPAFSTLHGLRHLEMRACRLQACAGRGAAALPQCVAQLPGLTHLDLGINRLADLPGGPYLAHLQQLVLRCNALRALPRALAGAPRLQLLDVGENEDLVLQGSDVEGVLGRMPDLRHLVLSRQPSGFGFGPYISAGSGAAWDAQSVGVLMQLARSLPTLCVHLERDEQRGAAAPPPPPPPQQPYRAAGSAACQ
ncbi:hypothetical protein CHLNCDRAFT_138138 [Chlorella variabilis]|uniref:F-box domain-containing protein n=1 Tax=Chlorella variabilis TaxID=554065 RepID=E1Z5C7_CHLVA|nr:hypothetical protein CHLNCDRAFT_138138 [Chlorella variabilis]EFN59504.1 hypothetical protein CHLNCDRAFT_138138 [Chlorella variabilis]|eukprot:XP_005851606.1 hypothetical protein CHLNCDRAFT_138138 [Chlorella variabilis]